MKQLSRPRGEYVERIIRDKNGQLVRATFCVYECNGHIKARLLNAEFLTETLSNKKVIAIDGIAKKEFREIIDEIGKTISPYFTFDTLYFSGSKPRAPTI